MVRIEAIIRPSRLDEVKSALWMNWEFGASPSPRSKARVSRRAIPSIIVGLSTRSTSCLKCSLVVVVTDSQQESVIGAIEGAARTGEIGDGKIFVTPVMEAIRIRTGERGDIAVS